MVLYTARHEDEIGHIYHRPWFVQAPIIIAACAIASQTWVPEIDRFNARLIDTAIGAAQLILAATCLEVDICWVAAFNGYAGGTIFHLLGEVEPVIFTLLGYSAYAPRAKIRKRLPELVHYEQWNFFRRKS